MAYYYKTYTKESSTFNLDGDLVHYIVHHHEGPFDTEAECAEYAARYGLSDFEIVEIP